MAAIRVMFGPFDTGCSSVRALPARRPPFPARQMQVPPRFVDVRGVSFRRPSVPDYALSPTSGAPSDAAHRYVYGAQVRGRSAYSSNPNPSSFTCNQRTNTPRISASARDGGGGGGGDEAVSAAAARAMAAATKRWAVALQQWRRRRWRTYHAVRGNADCGLMCLSE